jgi:hypothetical protein
MISPVSLASSRKEVYLYYVDRDADPEKTKAGILAGTTNFMTAYTEVFGMAPDHSIWNQLVGY